MGDSSNSYLSSLYQQALFEGISEDDVSSVTLHGKCRLICDLVGALRGKLPQRIMGTVE